MTRVPFFDWQERPGPIGPGWLMMFTRLDLEPAEPERHSGFTFLPGALREDLLQSAEAARKKRRARYRPREAEALALLLLARE